MIEVSLRRPWLLAQLPGPMRVLSWAPHRPGLIMADRIVWREVRDADLGPEFDAEDWLAAQLARCGLADAVGLLTSRDLSAYRLSAAEAEGVRASCLATVGLGNAESVGRRISSARVAGTINLLVVAEAGLTEAAQLEALSIAAEARTAAVMEAGLVLPTGPATGTGTDCIALACRPGPMRYAGLHTAVGEAIGAAVRTAVLDGARDWCRARGDAAGTPVRT
ncbi:adenosylcobinamide amidohydrolase [Rhodobacter sp. CZR27]|uniref:adenosylcobinamide amidohydrolase n=1 Tax=Rhodobacter sp. CZR27 TaxID=2033869 RepID=UPI000BBEED6E|nr:adenosylcobinamide amidohydrolase [Rhodobacter sp. CZR27]